MKKKATRGVIQGIDRLIVFCITSGHASWVRIWNMDIRAKGKVEKLSSFRLQNNCMAMLEVISSKWIVKITKL